MTVTTGGGKQTRYSMQVLDSGDRVRTIETPTGAKTKVTVRVDGITEKVDADGTKTTFETAPDPRWGAQVPVIAVQTVDHAGRQDVDRQAQGHRVAVRPA